MKQTYISTAELWNRMIRIIAMVFLFVSAFMAICLALVISVLGAGENGKLLQSALILFGAVAAAVGWVLRRQDYLSWKHWIAIVALAMPGALYTLFR